MRTEDARPIRLRDYRPPAWLVETVNLDFALDPSRTRVRARLAIKPNPAAREPAPLVLDGDELELAGLAIDGTPLAADAFAAGSDALTIFQPPNRPFVLEIETLLNPTANTRLMGLYRTGGTYCTQCEAEGFRRITYFPDRPDVMAVYTTRIEAARARVPVLLANGNLLETGDIAGTDRHFAVWHDPFPKPSYLFALVGGDLGCIEDSYTTVSGRAVALRIYVEHGKEPRAHYAMDALKRAMRWDEQTFGREYDLDVFMIVAVSDFNMGAMENKGLNVFNDKYILASPQTATDADYTGIEAVVAHEYFHNWTGNRITCRDWFQLCLKEGLTVFRDQEFTSDQRSRAVKRIADVRQLRAAQFVEDAGPLAHPVRPATYREINNFYTATVYEKGAEVVRMLKTLLGAAAFRNGMDLYFARHDGEAATVENFIQCFAEASGADLGPFMRWYRQAGTPQVTVDVAYDDKARTCTLAISQIVPPTPGQPTKEPMPIPLALGLLDADGKEIPLYPAPGTRVEHGVIVSLEQQARFEFTGVSLRPIVSINRGFSAPIKLRIEQSMADLRLLAASDGDPFNRWQALQSLATKLLVEKIRPPQSRPPMPGIADLVAALQALLSDRALEPAFVALALALPTETDIARELERDIDPGAIFAARTALRQEIGTALREPLASAYAAMSDARPYSPDAASAGRRALKNICLDLQAATGTQAAIVQAVVQYQTSDNMTDRLAALSTLSHHDVPERPSSLDDFYARFKDDALVIDKWFTLQAAIAEAATLDRVRRLLGHTSFSLANPNRVRALIGTFANANPTQFNRPDGAGYEFVADVVLEVDPNNPQVAARLLTAFRAWRTMEPGRRNCAERTLTRIARTPGLSRDAADIVGRTLANS